MRVVSSLEIDLLDQKNKKNPKKGGNGGHLLG
jgi:hypothetical protein